jgi:hypothetical protein
MSAVSAEVWEPLDERHLTAIEKFREMALNKGYRIIGETIVMNDVPKLIYTIRYLREQLEGKKKHEPFMKVDPATGEILIRQDEPEPEPEAEKPPLKLVTVKDVEPLPEEPPEVDPLEDDPWWVREPDD